MLNQQELKDLAKETLNKLNDPFDVNRYVALVRDGEINTPFEIEQLIQYTKRELTNYKRQMYEHMESRCKEHAYYDWTFSVRKTIIGNYRYFYERKCKHCGFTEYTWCDEQEDCPDGAEKAKETYYNNNL
jgi:hypothetical protein